MRFSRRAFIGCWALLLTSVNAAELRRHELFQYNVADRPFIVEALVHNSSTRVYGVELDLRIDGATLAGGGALVPGSLKLVGEDGFQSMGEADMRSSRLVVTKCSIKPNQITAIAGGFEKPSTSWFIVNVTKPQPKWATAKAADCAALRKQPLPAAWR